MMIPPGECTYAGRKRRKPVQKQRPATGAEKSNPSKRHRDRLNAELDHLASLLPLPPDIVSKLDKLSVLRLSVSYLRVKSFFQAVPKGPWQPGVSAPSPEDRGLSARSAVLEGRLLLETMQFQGKLKFLFGQKRKAPSGTVLPPRLSLFCIVVPVLLPSVAEMTMTSAFLRVKHRMDVSASMDAKVRAAASPCEPEFHGKPSYFAGRNNGENIPVLRTQADAGRWARVPARAQCLCLRNGPDLVSDPEGAAGDRSGDEHGRVPSGSSGARGRREIHAYSCCFEAPGPVKHLSWMTGKHGQDGGTKLKLESSKSDPFSMCAVSLGSCVPCPGVQGAVHTSGVTAFRNSPSCHPGSHSPSAYTSRTSRTSRALRDSDQGQVHPPPSCPFPQGSLDNGLPQPRGQRLTAVGHSIEDTKFRGGPTPSGAPCNPILSLDVPIKMESDSGSEDAADGYSMSPSQVWLGASGMAKRQLVTFPTRMHLKTEPEARHHLYAPHLGHSLLEAHPSGRAPLRPGRELTPFHPAHCACLERVHGLPEPDRPHHFCAQGHQPPALGCDCRAPGTTPIVKREPLDSALWASHSQGGVPGMFPKSAVATLMPPKAPECAFLP
ncbi:aryl hydrocarbon receptor repressor isoform X3 [Zalophus californianus]|uniref:Aryl hydrocarbon receptor repressor isoform X3 n=1 Tax=Zalophus californianus TaxID=9704 RepID=A0A6J2E3L2_ZALCA|nr:aryl hydrocarbon receptor repressor isoform X3 [Zalophus californianus]